jgi:DNA-binding transcriptional ArsR family regulator
MKSQDGKKDFKDLRKSSESVAVVLKQLSHPQRLLILCCLIAGERTVGEIVESCGASQSSVSQFLKVMRLEGLVDSRRDGKQIYYRIVDKRVFKLIKSLATIFCEY